MHVIGTAGHVDHGKSTLVEALTGIDPDRFAEEKRRGLTIDLGFAWTTLPSGTEIAIVDVPGHERFIKNMLAGAGAISICLLVVDASEGWKPQSREHLAILDVLGISLGVVALTKSDTVDETTVRERRTEIEKELRGTRLQDLPIVACSAVTGNGIEELLDKLDEAVRSAPPMPDEGLPRLWVDRVFTMKGAGTIVTGTLWGGSLSTGDEVDILPPGRRARIRSIQSHKREHGSIGPGNRVALNLAGLERSGADRGDAVVRPGWWRTTRRLDVRIELSKNAAPGHELTEKGSHLFYAGAAETPVRIRLYQVRRLAPGEGAFAQLSLRDPLPLKRGDRFVLRDAGRVLTFGGGIVLDPMAPVSPRADAAKARLLEELVHADAPRALELLLDHYRSLPMGEALYRSGLLDAPPELPRLGSILLSLGEMASMQRRLVSLLEEHHARHPLEKGMARARLPNELGIDEDETDDLVSATPESVAEGAVVRLKDHEVSLDPAQAKERDRLLADLEQAGFSPPMTADLRADPRLLRALVDAGEIVKIDGFYFTARAATEARRRVRDAIAQTGAMTVAQIRDLLGTSRKYAVPLCEWLDATGATRRKGDLRDLGPRGD